MYVEVDNEEVVGGEVNVGQEDEFYQDEEERNNENGVEKQAAATTGEHTKCVLVSAITSWGGKDVG